MHSSEEIRDYCYGMTLSALHSTSISAFQQFENDFCDLVDTPGILSDDCKRLEGLSISSQLYHASSLNISLGDADMIKTQAKDLLVKLNIALNKSGPSHQQINEV